MIVRPSMRSTASESSVTVTDCARASRFSAAKALIPFLQKQIALLHHMLCDGVQLRAAEPSRPFEGDRMEPELRRLVLTSHMDVRRFTSIQRDEEDNDRVQSQGLWASSDPFAIRRSSQDGNRFADSIIPPALIVSPLRAAASACQDSCRRHGTESRAADALRQLQGALCRQSKAPWPFCRSGGAQALRVGLSASGQVYALP